MRIEGEENVFELILGMLSERFKNDGRKAALAKAMFKEYLVSGRRGLDRIVKREISKILESEKNEV